MKIKYSTAKNVMDTIAEMVVEAHHSTGTPISQFDLETSVRGIFTDVCDVVGINQVIDDSN